tara:strand:- start:15 stop:221 length:207 start_codon:yes stop_codon:yes gene_type:complete
MYFKRSGAYIDCLHISAIIKEKVVEDFSRFFGIGFGHWLFYLHQQNARRASSGGTKPGLSDWPTGRHA